MPITDVYLDNLRRGIVYIGSPKNFNDPFDCQVIPRIKSPTDDQINRLKDFFSDGRINDKNEIERMNTTPNSKLGPQFVNSARHHYMSHINHFMDTRGVTCFTQKHDSTQMWAYYADAQKGLCLEFYTTSSLFDKIEIVRYIDDIPEYNIDDIFIDFAFEDDFRLMFRTKEKKWEHEKEWRIIHEKAGTEYYYPPEYLKTIYLGTRVSAEDRMEILKLIGEKYQRTMVKQAIPDDGFSLTFENAFDIID